ncbi:MAG: hypothetical protein AAGH41_00340 [Pseudomonadota bacterium]
MTERIPIRSLIDRCKAPEVTGPSKTALPKPLQDSKLLWDGVAVRYAEKLSDMLGTEVDVSVELIVTNHAAYRQSAPKPGILLPLSDDDGGPLARFDGAASHILAERLLKTRAGTLDENFEPDDNDGLLTRELLVEFAHLLDTAFGLCLPVPEKLYPSVHWPLTPPPSGTRLLAEMALTLSGDERLGFDILFETSLVRFFADLLTGASGSLSPRAVTMDLTGVLSRWSTDVRALSDIQPGSVLIIPGADLEKVSLELGDDGTSTVVAQGTLGTDRGRHALQINDLSEAS